MKSLGAIIVLASFAAFILGVINIIAPQAWMRARKRLVGAFIVLGSMGGCVAGLSVMPPPNPSTVSTITMEEALRQGEKLDGSPRPNSMSQIEFDATWNDVKARIERCDGPNRRAARAMMAGDERTAISLTSAAIKACKGELAAFGNVQIPDSASGIVRRSLTESIQTCRGAVQLKLESAEKTRDFLNGDQRPSTVEGLNEALQAAGRATANCGFGFMQTANYAQLNIPDLPGLRAYVAAPGAVEAQ